MYCVDALGLPYIQTILSVLLRTPPGLGIIKSTSTSRRLYIAFDHPFLRRTVTDNIDATSSKLQGGHCQPLDLPLRHNTPRPDRLKGSLECPWQAPHRIPTANAHPKSSRSFQPCLQHIHRQLLSALNKPGWRRKRAAGRQVIRIIRTCTY
ncbi:hypothetical protein BOTBODRAFT_427395 [Botryobasidium botryosum FD-172 SS1]|uniref:Uncharacterized protein n=1 Tax=Botryobasidium botryosum (strain FD-172 SS1) TaxID=930990 RepID=A0A067MJB3_BOTB1|nr:hypothetical protein BOTBODRAFT_427395 [Botryobasidium botryosum FD-172 SS1]